MLENEKWKVRPCPSDPLPPLHQSVRAAASLVENCDNYCMVESVPVFLNLLSDYFHLADQLPLATQEIGML